MKNIFRMAVVAGLVLAGVSIVAEEPSEHPVADGKSKPEGGKAVSRAPARPAAKDPAPRTGAAQPKPHPSTTEPLKYENCRSYNYPGRHAAILKVKAELNPQVVLIGDSITHHWGGVPGDRLKNGEQVLKSDLAKYRILNLGFGHDRTQHVIWRLQNGEIDGLNPDWVVIHIGTNNTSDGNTAEEIMAGIRVICQEVRARTPKARIVLMSILPHEKNPKSRRRLLIDATNRLIARYAAEQGFVHLDIGREFLDDQGAVKGSLMPDACHPNADGYRIWARALNQIFGGTTR